jgi:hypothetical protein
MGVVGRLDQYASMLAYEFDDYSMSENLLLRSNSFNTGTWTPVSATCVFAQNVTGPDNISNSAWTIDDQSTANDGAGFEQTKSITPSTTTNYCLSIFVKQGTATILDFYAFFIGNSTKGSYLRYTFSTNTISVFSADGGGITPTIYGKVSYPNGWIRIYFVVNDANNGLNNNLLYRIYPASRDAGPIGTTLFYGAQLETGSVATDYTPTTTTAISRVLPATTNTNITGLGTYYSSGFDENVGFTTFLSANIFAPYDLVYDEFSGTSFGAGQGRYMRQNTDKSVIVYNEIDEVSDFRDIVRSGLILDLDAGMNASFNNTGTAWNDLSGSGNNGTLVNGPTYSSANNGSIVFDGSNDYITSPFATTSGQAVTYCGWLYSTETAATYRNFVDSVTANPMIWWNTTGQIEFDAANWTTAAVYRNQWVYVALSKPSGSSSASYYVNGVLVGTGGAYTTPALTPTWFNRAAAQTWKGNASNVQAYNRALTATEVSQNYNALKHRFGL